MTNEHIYVAFRPAPTILGDYYSSNQRQVHSLLKRSDCGLYPELYAEGLCKPGATNFNKALDEYHDFLEQLSERSPKRAIAMHSQVMDQVQQQGGSQTNLMQVAQLLQNMGRGGDTILAHITPEEARLLKDHGGSGTRNPNTGLLEFRPPRFGRPGGELTEKNVDDGKGDKLDGSSDKPVRGGRGNGIAELTERRAAQKNEKKSDTEPDETAPKSTFKPRGRNKARFNLLGEETGSSGTRSLLGDGSDGAAELAVRQQDAADAKTAKEARLAEQRRLRLTQQNEKQEAEDAARNQVIAKTTEAKRKAEAEKLAKDRFEYGRSRIAGEKMKLASIKALSGEPTDTSSPTDLRKLKENYFGGTYTPKGIVKKVNSEDVNEWNWGHPIELQKKLIEEDNQLSKPVNTLVYRELKGTTFFGGAGMDGDYIKDMVDAFTELGIENVRAANPNIWSSSNSIIDALSVPFSNDENDNMSDFSSFKEEGKQFNLVGYSYGGVEASQAAIDYAKLGGTVDNLVLIGTPIEKGFLDELQKNPNIKNIRILNLKDQGDPLYAGMSDLEIIKSVPELQNQQLKQTNEGHFYYAGSGDEGRNRRRELAKFLKGEGLK